MGMTDGAVTMTLNPRRWWGVRALLGHPLARRVDRFEAWVVVSGIVLLIVAAFGAAHVHDELYADRSRAVAVEAATRHQVEATAVETSRAKPTGPAQGAPLNQTVRVEWFAQNTTHSAVATVDHPVKAGSHVPIFVDDRGQVSRPPQTDANAQADANGLAILLWLLSLAAIATVGAVIRRALNRVRHRGWDRELVTLINDGGGSSTRRP
jgi:hypothetical protein